MAWMLGSSTIRNVMRGTVPYQAARAAYRTFRPAPLPPPPQAAPAPPPMPVYYPRPIALPEDTPEQRAIVERVKSQTWYHTIDLGHGIRTPGEFDHGPALHHYPLPADLTGKRCLDVATFDGYWAFEMERRGAAEVVALDIESWLDLDLPPHIIEDFKRRGITGKTGAGFQIAHETLNSKVQRRICNMYDLSPKEFGEFDYVVCSDVLVHITNPHHALRRIRSVTRGEAMFVETYLPGSEGQGAYTILFAKLEDCRWWIFGHDFLPKALEAAGFSRVEETSPVDIRVRFVPELAAQRQMLRAFP